MRRERRDLSELTLRASKWLMSQQSSNGGWAYTPDQEYPQLNGDITLGVYLSQTRTTAFAIDTVDTAASALTARRDPVEKPLILPPIIAPQ
jgi:hypothetical protein